ncbi:hypothetical protein KKG24_04395 [Patescibacteria group bacterium]|nr:hypothetical protein [Patescibacteria group bacterium]
MKKNRRKSKIVDAVRILLKTKELRNKYLYFQIFDQEKEKLFANLEIPAGNAEFIKRLIWQNDRLMPRRAGNIRK